MKVSVLSLIAPMVAILASTVVGENHYWCACQQSSGSSTLVDGNTRQCCTNQGGSFPNYQDVTQVGVEVSVSGNYCYKSSGDIHGNDFYNCCAGKTGSSDSTCY